MEDFTKTKGPPPKRRVPSGTRERIRSRRSKTPSSGAAPRRRSARATLRRSGWPRDRVRVEDVEHIQAQHGPGASEAKNLSEAHVDLVEPGAIERARVESGASAVVPVGVPPMEAVQDRLAPPTGQRPCLVPRRLRRIRCRGCSGTRRRAEPRSSERCTTRGTSSAAASSAPCGTMSSD